jgi:pseudouridine-5'-monophosphatase
LSDLSDIEAVIFDMDGVLLDTEPLYTEATNEVLREFGKVFDWSLKVELMGRNPLESARMLLTALDVPLTPEQFLARERPILERLFQSAPEMNGARHLVAALAERGYDLAIATSSSRRMFELKSARHEWFSLFSVVVCGDHPSVKALKPEPDIFISAARELGVEPGRCLVIEDSLAGVEAARRAGARVVALPDRAVDASRYAGADLVVREHAELHARLFSPARATPERSRP